VRAAGITDDRVLHPAAAWTQAHLAAWPSRRAVPFAMVPASDEVYGPAPPAGVAGRPRVFYVLASKCLPRTPRHTGGPQRAEALDRGAAGRAWPDVRLGPGRAMSARNAGHSPGPHQAAGSRPRARCWPAAPSPSDPARSPIIHSTAPAVSPCSHLAWTVLLPA